jgi:hypothetical protein
MILFFQYLKIYFIMRKEGGKLDYLKIFYYFLLFTLKIFFYNK